MTLKNSSKKRINSPVRYFITMILSISILLNICVFSSNVYAEELSNYRWITNNSYSSYSYSSITYGANRFVAVGLNGAIKTSDDGISWIKRESNTQHWLRRVIWTGKKFFAVGYGYSPITSRPVAVIISSEDGMKWDSEEIDTESDIRLGGIAWNGSKYVAVGQGGICVSDDGDNWNFQTTQQGLEDIVWGNGKFIAVGYEYMSISSSEPVAKIISSDDGIEWKEINAGFTSYLNRIIWDGSKFISVGKNGIIIVSTDGVNWKQVESGVYFELSDIEYNEMNYVASGWDSKILTSLDGESWETFDSLAPSRVYSIAWGSDRYIGTGLKDPVTNCETFISSENGVEWSRCSLNSAATKFSGIGYDKKKGLFILENDEVGLMQSYDGMNWEQSKDQSMDNMTTKMKAFNGSIYVRIEKYGELQTSKDGIVWDSIDVNIISGINSVLWTGKMFIAVGYNGQIFTSEDGLQWIERLSGDMMYRDVVFNGKVYIAVGDVGETAVSKDGITWDCKRFINISGFERIIWDGERFVSVGRDGIVYSTSDGSRWDVFITSSGSDLKDILYEKGRYLILGEGDILLGIPKNNALLRFNGKAVETDVLPVIENGRTLVPIRVISELLEAPVVWNGDDKTVFIEKDSVEIKLAIDNTNAIVNNEAYSLEVPAKIINNRTMVPLRFIIDVLGLKVEWNNQNRTVDVMN